ncbi:MAG TPA: hypothetical protein VF326_02935 [Anaerolineaceae bacterium]
MDNPKTKPVKALIDQAVVWIPFLLGFWLIILRPLGPNLSLMPGDLGDTRFNNYLLEHFFRWILGLDKNYWNAAFFYPFPNTIAFSDNLLGTAPFYALFRATRLDRETAFQAWYMLGFLMNYTACVYVLQRLKLKPLAVAIAGFFFTYGLPILAQETHAQLLYRFGIPLACALLWQFFQEPGLKKLVGLAFWCVWQFFAGVYIGIFLVMLLAVMAVLLPLFSVQSWAQKNTDPWYRRAFKAVWQWITAWPLKLNQAGSETTLPGRLATLVILAGLGASLAALLGPYYNVTHVYGFSRSWNDVLLMLPKPQSYFIADQSPIWQAASGFIADFTARREHQLFPGGVIILILLVGISLRVPTQYRRLAFLNLSAVAILVAVTLTIHGFSLYHFLWYLPGLKSIRAVTRIELVLMWPLGVFAGYVIDALLQRQRLWLNAIIYLAGGLLLLESVFYNHTTTSKADAQARLANLRSQLATAPAATAVPEAALPADPILFVARPQWDPWYAPEIDAMLVAQDLGWPTLNGYSGNFPPGFQFADSCSRLPNQIKAYMAFTRLSDASSYLDIIKRVVPIGFKDCDPNWWSKMPN